MSGLKRMALVLLAVAVAAGCGKAEKAGDEAATEVAEAGPDTLAGTRKLSELDREEYVPTQKPTSRISPAVRDTLRRLKKRHRINRDEYWDGDGGVLANDYMEVWYPEGRTTVTHAMRVFNILMPARHKLRTYFGTGPDERVVINCPPDLKAYKTRTGREWWYYAEISGDTLTFQPIFVLVKRGLDNVALPHEYFQWAIGKMSRHGAPRWLEEGYASYLSGEEKILESQMLEFPDGADAMEPGLLETILDSEDTKKETRIAYYRSYRMVKKLVDTYGEDSLKEAVNLLGQGHTVDDAFRGAFGNGYEDVLRVAADYSIHLDMP
ncbi:MAG: peptidase MA family metallohydrolase [Candidatus Krumholzibacteriia bacterium]